MNSHMTRALLKFSGCASLGLLTCLFFFFPGNTGFSLKEPRIETINLGIIKTGSIVNRALEFTEEIKDPVSDCERVKVKLGKKSGSLYLLKVAFYAEDVSGSFERTIRLKDKDNNPILIRLKAVVVKK